MTGGWFIIVIPTLGRMWVRNAAIQAPLLLQVRDILQFLGVGDQVQLALGRYDAYTMHIPYVIDYNRIYTTPGI